MIIIYPKRTEVIDMIKRAQNPIKSGKLTRSFVQQIFNNLTKYN